MYARRKSEPCESREFYNYTKRSTNLIVLFIHFILGYHLLLLLFILFILVRVLVDLKPVLGSLGMSLGMRMLGHYHAFNVIFGESVHCILYNRPVFVCIFFQVSFQKRASRKTGDQVQIFIFFHSFDLLILFNLFC